ncbi:MAG: permease-like cell division protein FtsX [Clostridia bacterium]|nr:permease-like cell division protein FtsX [Clostridia bacterium]MBR5679302.1 permease-like cell division protein FtsX [Clostridia bacterium]
MRRYNPFYFIGQAFEGLWRNGVMSFASIAVLTSLLVVIGGFTLLVTNIDVNLDEFGLINQIVVFCDPNATDEQITEIGEAIGKLDNIESVEHVTKEEGLEQMKAEYDIYDDVSEENNPLPDSFVITYLENEKVPNLDYQLNQIEGIAKVNNRLDLATKIEGFKRGVMLVFVWFLVILGVVSIFIIINTIKLSVFSRRNEISIMQYVGATGWFISLPYLIEGAIIGIVSSVAAYFIEWYIYSYIEEMVITDLQMISILQFSDIRAYVFWGFLGLGIITGVVGSIISLARYLRQ